MSSSSRSFPPSPPPPPPSTAGPVLPNLILVREYLNMPRAPSSSSMNTTTDELTLLQHFVKKKNLLLPPRGQPQEQQRRDRLSIKKMNFNIIPTNILTQLHVHEIHGNESWRYQILEYLHNPFIQYSLMILLLMDVLLLFVEIFLLATFPPCYTIQRDAISCCPLSSSSSSSHDDAYVSTSMGILYNNSATRATSSFLLLFSWIQQPNDPIRSSNQHNNDNNLLCGPNLTVSWDYPATCDPHKWIRVHRTEYGLFVITIGILCIFLIELVLTMIAIGPNIFFLQFFFLLDFIIVTISLILELTFHLIDDNEIQSLIGLLICGRLWRFVRIGHGIIELTNEIAQQDYHQLLTYTGQLEQLLQIHQVSIPNRSNILEDEIHYNRTDNSIASGTHGTTLEQGHNHQQDERR